MLPYIVHRNKTIKLLELIVLFFFITLAIFLALFNYKRVNRKLEPSKKSIPTETSEENTSFKPPFFYGVNVEMSQLLPTSENYVVNDNGEDLIDIAANLGVNIFRITNGTKFSENDNDYIYTKLEWDAVLNKMHKYGIAALILIESPTIYQKDIIPEYLNFAQNYIIDSDVLSHPAVYGLDLYNEPVISDHNLELLKTVSNIVKSKYPDIPLTVGWWAVETKTKDSDEATIYKWDDYSAGRVFEDFTDFYSLHMYGFDSRDNLFRLLPEPYQFTRKFITKVKQGLQTQKPLLIGEFGSANGETVSDQDTIGSPQLQAKTYEGVYKALKSLRDSQIIGSIAFQFYQRSGSPDAWAILKNRGNYLFPAAYVLQKYAKGKDQSLDSSPD